MTEEDLTIRPDYDRTPVLVVAKQDKIELTSTNSVRMGMKTNELNAMSTRSFQANTLAHSGYGTQLLWCLVLSLLLIISWSSYAASDKDITLKAEHRQHLLGLESLIKPESVDLGNLKDRVVLVTFFASWCPPCRDEFKALNELQRQLENEAFAIVAVNVFEEFDDNDGPRMEKFLNDTKPQFHVVEGTDETRALFGGINRIPTLITFDQKGKEAFNFVHARGATKQSVESEELMAAIKPLL